MLHLLSVNELHFHCLKAFRLQQEWFPGVIGAIDGCHIEMKQPPGNANDYYNRKGTHSIILQGENLY